LSRVSPDRQRIVDFLTTHGPVEDRSGRATSVLKEAISYEASDGAFSQLVATMDYDGEIVREIRGKRTYRISVPRPATISPHPSAAELPASEDVDYDELAATLLARTAQILATSQEPAEAVGWARRRIQQLEGRVGELERELARAKAETNAVTGERDELRGQLEAASHNLSLLTERGQSPQRGRASERLGSDERALLYELRGQRRSSGRLG